MITPVTPVAPHDALSVTTFAAEQPEYKPLPAHVEPDGTVTTRWHVGWMDRLRLLLVGDLWLQVLTLHQPLQPMSLTSTCPLVGGPSPESKRP